MSNLRASSSFAVKELRSSGETQRPADEPLAPATQLCMLFSPLLTMEAVTLLQPAVFGKAGVNSEKSLLVGLLGSETQASKL